MSRVSIVYFVVMLLVYAWLSVALINGQPTAALPLVGHVDALTGMAFTSLMTLIGVATFILPHLLRESLSADPRRSAKADDAQPF